MYDPNATAVMRPKDYKSFRIAAMVQVYILVRQTNPQSVQWIGKPGYIAKPIECKPKTADTDLTIEGRSIETAGLVVNPELLGFSAVFKSERKAGKAKDAWKKFVADHPPAQCLPRDGKPIRTWVGAQPGWAVQMCKNSEHYGCLMYSTYPQGLNGKYVHGDYDLFGIAAAADSTTMRRLDEKLRGLRSPNTQSVQFSVNAMTGFALVKHGEQELFADFEEEPLDVFFPGVRLGRCAMRRRPANFTERNSAAGSYFLKPAFLPVATGRSQSPKGPRWLSRSAKLLAPCGSEPSAPQAKRECAAARSDDPYQSWPRDNARPGLEAGLPSLPSIPIVCVTRVVAPDVSNSSSLRSTLDQVCQRSVLIAPWRGAPYRSGLRGEAMYGRRLSRAGRQLARSA
jgi:hypothetical protein